MLKLINATPAQARNGFHLPERSAPARTGAASLAAPASSGAGRAPLYSVTWTESGQEHVVLFSTFRGACAHSLFQTQRGQLPALGTVDRAAGEGAPLAGKGPAQAGGVSGSRIPDGNHGDNLKPTQDRRTAVTVLDVIASVGFVDAVSTVAGVVCGVLLGVSLVGAVVA